MDIIYDAVYVTALPCQYGCTSIEVQARTASQGEMAVKASGLGYTFAGAKGSAVIYRGNTVTFVYYTK